MFLALAVAVLFPVVDRFFVYPLFSSFVLEQSEIEAERVARYLSQELKIEPGGLQKDSLQPMFYIEVAHALNSLGLIKLKVFSPSGEVIYSSDYADIGMINTKPYFLQEVTSGQIYSVVVRKERPTLEGQIATADVVETYVPLQIGGQFAGAFEVYFDITAPLQKIERLLFIASILLVIVGFTLLAAVLWTLARASDAIVARERTERALSNSEKRYRSVVDASPDAILLQTDSGIVFVNPALVSMLGGQQRAEIINRNLTEFMVPEDQRFFTDIVADAMSPETSDSQFYEINLRKINGSRVNVELAAFGSEYDGSPAVLVVIHDLTFRREAEQYQRMASIVFETSADAMMMTDAEGIIQTVNPAFTEITGYKAEDVLFKDSDILWIEHNSEDFLRNLHQSLQSQDSWRGELWSKHSNGERYAQRLTVSAIREGNGSIAKFVSVFSDITTSVRLT